MYLLQIKMDYFVGATNRNFRYLDKKFVLFTIKNQNFITLKYLLTLRFT